jgi:ParB family transcriptional regulator, chromosome partitioning protein
MATSNNKRIEQWPLERLTPHPKQGLLFSNPPESEVKELAADLQRNGQLQPVEALPNGTTIAGHKRTAAAKRLGWTEITVWVREDLANDPAAAEKRLIQDNLNRRQLGPLALARCYKRLKELDNRHTGVLSACARHDLRDQIGKRLGVSGRTLDRYLRVLDGTPAEVQAAVEAGALPVTLAEQVADLGKELRAEVAEEIREGGDPGKVVRRFLKKKDNRHKLPRDAKAAFIKSLQRGLADLDGRVEQVCWITPEEQETLRQGQELVKQLRTRAGSPRPAGPSGSCSTR